MPDQFRGLSLTQLFVLTAEKFRRWDYELGFFASECDEPSFFQSLQCRLETSRRCLKFLGEVIDSAAILILQSDGVYNSGHDVLRSALKGFEFQLWLFLLLAMTE